MRNALVMLGAAALVACASELKVPITGQFSGQPSAGQATARSDGTGSFWVQTPRGARCQGGYNPLDTNPTIVVNIYCDDGRRGEAVIARQMDGLSGTAVVSLNDGTSGQFVFGNIKLDQAFGDGGRASTVPTIITR